MKDFYEAYYSRVGHSQAHHLFCERAFGKDLAQHGLHKRYLYVVTTA